MLKQISTNSIIGLILLVNFNLKCKGCAPYLSYIKYALRINNSPSFCKTNFQRSCFMLAVANPKFYLISEMHNYVVLDNLAHIKTKGKKRNKTIYDLELRTYEK